MSFELKDLVDAIKDGKVTWTSSTGDVQTVSEESFKSESADGDFNIEGIGETEPVTQFREDEYYHSIFKIKGDDRLWRYVGDYSSWDGVEWSYAELEEVKAIQVTKTEYVRA